MPFLRAFFFIFINLPYISSSLLYTLFSSLISLFSSICNILYCFVLCPSGFLYFIQLASLMIRFSIYLTLLYNLIYLNNIYHLHDFKCTWVTPSLRCIYLFFTTNLPFFRFLFTESSILYTIYYIVSPTYFFIIKSPRVLLAHLVYLHDNCDTLHICNTGGGDSLPQEGA